MTFALNIPHANSTKTAAELRAGERLFVLGANGTGKSSLLHGFAAANRGHARRITAHRQTWLNSDAIAFLPSQKPTIEQQLTQWDSQPQSRWSEQNAGQRSNITLYDLINAENVDARTIATTLRSGDVARAQELALQSAPIATINALLARSNIPISIAVEGGDRLMASKSGGPSYGAAELSDGERNALLISADVLTAKPGTLLIIDEPERHLHRSIISPLLTQLFRMREDCAFVIATHDLTLPLDNPDARVLLVRSCSFANNRARAWEADILPADAEIDDGLKQDILGARRTIIFVEGDESSLDKPMYSTLFPLVSVRTKGSSRDVEYAVAGIRSTSALHWAEAWGIIDRDGRDDETVGSMKEAGIYAVPFYSVESVYYHPLLVKAVANRQAKVDGANADARFQEAISAALRAVEQHLDRLAARAVEKGIRRQLFQNLPRLEDIRAGKTVSLNIDTADVRSREVASLQKAVADSDWAYVCSRCPVRETSALSVIASSVGLRSRQQFESAVIQVLRDDAEVLAETRKLFGDLAEKASGSKVIS